MTDNAHGILPGKSMFFYASPLSWSNTGTETRGVLDGRSRTPHQELVGALDLSALHCVAGHSYRGLFSLLGVSNVDEAKQIYIPLKNSRADSWFFGLGGVLATVRLHQMPVLDERFPDPVRASLTSWLATITTQPQMSSVPEAFHDFFTSFSYTQVAQDSNTRDAMDSVLRNPADTGIERLVKEYLSGT